MSVVPRFRNPVSELFFFISDLFITLISIYHQLSPCLYFFALVLGKVKVQLEKGDCCQAVFGFVLFLSISGCLLPPFSLSLMIAWALILGLRSPSGILSHSGTRSPKVSALNFPIASCWSSSGVA